MSCPRKARSRTREPAPGRPLLWIWIGFLLAAQGSDGDVPGLANMAPVPRDMSSGKTGVVTSCPAELEDEELLENPRAPTTIVIWRSQSKLGFYQHGELAHVDERTDACFELVLGLEPRPPVMGSPAESPLGWYWVWRTSPIEKEAYSKAIFLSYPRAEDAATALADGRIDQEAHDRIELASYFRISHSNRFHESHWNLA